MVPRMLLTPEQLAAIKGFVPPLLIGALCFTLAFGVSRFFGPARRYRTLVFSMLIAAVAWYAYFLPDFADASGPAWQGWGPDGGMSRLFGRRLGIHTIWAWVVAALLSRSKRKEETHVV